ncbi:MULTISPECIES: hypothetical protein [unclassified Streptomyces]|uniref:hypothetical protein n=1 Tax=unclassified Streptomyces TaxID=2593676 RepID=UPI0007484BBF|nr:MULTISPECIES: hypothetical protein [unclassified Streptomyces]KUL50028.1 hypothetical protein ADL30_31180 [Streptomyces sp. NRRL S-1521]THC42065.1 hypothetical protein E7X58_36150 [Streptomyces sp. A1499]
MGIKDQFQDKAQDLAERANRAKGSAGDRDETRERASRARDEARNRASQSPDQARDAARERRDRLGRDLDEV